MQPGGLTEISRWRSAARTTGHGVGNGIRPGGAAEPCARYFPRPVRGAAAGGCGFRWFSLRSTTEEAAGNSGGWRAGEQANFQQASGLPVRRAPPPAKQSFAPERGANSMAVATTDRNVRAYLFEPPLFYTWNRRQILQRRKWSVGNDCLRHLFADIWDRIEFLGARCVDVDRVKSRGLLNSLRLRG